MESTEYATLEENGKIISNDKQVARIINKCFLNNHDFLINAEYLDDPIDKVIIKYNRHPSILIWKVYTKVSDSTFSFQHDSKEKNTKIIKKLDSKTVMQSTDVPTKLLKDFFDFFSDYFYDNIKKCVTKGE